nr:MAG TPA: hypothetical protein [Caudoviricetes sp.]
MTLWTWDGIQQNFKVAGETVTPFKAQITAYTDILGYGMYIEFKSNTNLDKYVGNLVHNTPDHVGTTPADLNGFFWCLQLAKIAKENDKSYTYCLFDLTFGNSKDWSLHEEALGNRSASPAIRALMNANPDVTNLFLDGENPVDGTQYFESLNDSKTNVFYSGIGNDGDVKRDDFITWLKSSNERHSPKLLQNPTFSSAGINNLRWYLKPIPVFRNQQSYDYMLDEYEVEEIVDQNAVLPYTAVRQWAYQRLVYPGTNQKAENKNIVSMYTQYITKDGKIESLLQDGVAPQEVYGYPVFFTKDKRGMPPKGGAIKFIQLDVDQDVYVDMTTTLRRGDMYSVQRSFKIYRALDINQNVFYKGAAFKVSEVDYINEISVIGGTTGVI